MKKLWIIGIIAAFVGTGIVVRANCGSCGGHGKEAAAKGCKDVCAKWTEGITLTDEQKTKLAEVQKSCDGSKESCDKARTAIRATLTEEQQKTFDANVAKCAEAKGGCGAAAAGCGAAKAK